MGSFEITIMREAFTRHLRGWKTTVWMDGNSNVPIAEGRHHLPRKMAHATDRRFFIWPILPPQDENSLKDEFEY
ncbi:hypothetical protein CEXT_207371 [Caerostris extrusa]|uniref:Uncharacterized protein n=1 Tax=Caerostris extrusa TaxID=172846 RepID=A0AAV4VJ63_CAEEX|nr:hypothetical protein CEXT_207371 [Caerostris extrusa]